MNFSQLLNAEQLAAVTRTDGPLLVLAGAGTGKTRVITFRIAYLVLERGIDPSHILAVTFTNKAAGEMKSRLHELIGQTANLIWMGTFHSICLKMLREDGERVGLPASFSVVDQEDRLAIVRDALKELDIDSKKNPPKQYLHQISAFKNTPAYVNGDKPGALSHRFEEIFSQYERSLAAQNLVDFDDMMSFAIRILRDHPDVREKYRDRYRYILVDEYQDTNQIQFQFLRLLTTQDGNICVVGDDDQSIYGWRGAEVRNILEFDTHFPTAEVVKLTENYRSTADILHMANTLIRCNRMRKGKDLRPATDEMGEITVSPVPGDQDESRFVADEIEKHIGKGVHPSEIAVLYRTNAQSRGFEVELNRRQIPYKVVGGIGFYQRREVKDILSYLRLYDNPYDVHSFIRSVKNPGRGIGDATLDKIVTQCAAQNLSLLEGMRLFAPTLPSRQREAATSYLYVMERLTGYAKPSDMIAGVIKDSNYKEYLKQFEEEDDASRRLDNLYELYNSAKAFEEADQNASLRDFLGATSLVTSQDESAEGSVKLMTIHAAKGLEFDVVFIAGLEERLFPLGFTKDDDRDLEEERRLCYVAVTRAKKRLYLVYAGSRLMYGKREASVPSPFLREMGAMAVQRPKMDVTRMRSGGASAPAHERAANSDGGIRPGDKVTHPSFGEGTAIAVNGSGSEAKVDVFFKKTGMKKIIARFLTQV